MNAERRTIARVLGEVCKVYSTQRAVPQKVLTVLYDETKSLAATEQLSIKKMESFKESPSTVANYRNAVEAWSDLNGAVEALSEGELDEAYLLLFSAATPPEQKPAPVVAVAKGRRR